MKGWIAAMSACGNSKGEYRQPDSGIVLGKCDPVYGCPPPNEVVCIVVNKVYDECKNIQVNEDEFIFEADPDNTVTDVLCMGAELLEGPDCEVVRLGKVRVTFTYRVNLRIILQDEQEIDLYRDFTISKNLNIARAGEDGLFLQCSIPFLECLSCFIRSEEPDYDFIKTTIICCVGKYLLIKLLATVQLAVPAYGFCPEPPDCDEVLGECPDFNPPWPPYPTQTR
jgi:hypothetical protein